MNIKNTNLRNKIKGLDEKIQVLEKEKDYLLGEKKTFHNAVKYYIAFRRSFDVSKN